MVDCIVQNAASASGDGSAGRVQLRATVGVLTLPPVNAVGTVTFTLVAGGTGRSVTLAKSISGGDWSDVTVFSGIDTTGATYSFALNNASENIALRLYGASHALYIHDILVADGAAPEPSITLSGAVVPFSTTHGVASVPQTLTVVAQNLTDDLTVSAPAGFHVSTFEESAYAAMLTIAPIGGSVPSTPVYARLNGVALGSASGDITANSENAATQTVSVEGETGLAAPVTKAASAITPTGFVAEWHAVSGADDYRLDVFRVAEPLTVFEEDFSGFDGSGFAALPAGGQLDSGVWKALGFSDGAMNFGDTRDSGDFARGTSLGGVGTGGVFAFDTGAGNLTLGVQPGADDFCPGHFVLRIQNTTGVAMETLNVSYKIYVYNDQGRSSTFNFSHSADDTVYTAVTDLDYTSPVAADATPAWISVDKTVTIVGLNIGDGDVYYLRWSSDDAGGSGARDELALDDVLVTGPAALVFASGHENQSVSGTSQPVASLSPDTVYNYRVRAAAVSPALISPNSDIREVPTLSPAALSDIVRAADFVDPTGLPYLAYQADAVTYADSLEVARFKVRDGGSGGDTDLLSTTLTSLSLSIAGHEFLRRVALFDGETLLAEVAAAADVAFPELSFAVPDTASADLSVRVTFRETVTDNEQIRFMVTAATAASSGSSFAEPDAGGAESSIDPEHNRIAVIATKLVFVAIPDTVYVDEDFTVTLHALDANNNKDRDAVSTVTIGMEHGAGNLSGGSAQALTAGEGSWTGVRIDAPGAFAIRASAGELTDAISSSIEAGHALSSGDVTIIGYRTSNPDAFSFVTWQHIAGGTTLYFTDSGFFADGTLRSTEDTMSWLAPAGGVAPGTVVVVTCPPEPEPGFATLGTVVGKLHNLSTAGDQVFVGMDGAFPSSGVSVAPGESYAGTLLYGLNTHALWLADGAPNANTSYLPTELNAQFLNIAFSGAGNNGQYSGARNTYSSWLHYKEVVHAPANWTHESAGITVLDASPFVLAPLADEPTVQAANIGFSAVLPFQMEINWDSGDGAGRIVLCREGEPVDAVPQDGTEYTPVASFLGAGSLIGGGKVVYAGTGNSVLVTGLSPGMTYFVHVYEYSGSGGVINYLTDDADGNPASRRTPPGPNVAPGNLLVFCVDGEGSAPGANATRVTLQEFNRNGSLVNVWDLPAGSTSPRLTMTGNTAFSGKLTISPNGAYAAMLGYDAQVGTSIAADTERTIARLSILDGTLDLTTSGALGGDGLARGVAVDSTGSNFWTSSAGTVAQGVRYHALGDVTEGALLADVNARGIRVIGGQLYEWGAAGDNQGVFRVGDGLPVSGMPVRAGLSGISGAIGIECNGIFMADLDPVEHGYDTLWMARSSVGNFIGVSKYSKVGNIWVKNNTIDLGETYHIDGMIEDGTVHLYVVQGPVPEPHGLCTLRTIRATTLAWRGPF